MRKKIILATMAASLICNAAFAFNKPVTIQEQGSFMAGGKIITAEGNLNTTENFKDLSGNTLHGDHAYVFYQIPAKAKKYSLIFLHGYGQSGKVGKQLPTVVTAFKIFFWSAAIKLL